MGAGATDVSGGILILRIAERLRRETDGAIIEEWRDALAAPL